MLSLEWGSPWPDREEEAAEGPEAAPPWKREEEALRRRKNLCAFRPHLFPFVLSETPGKWSYRQLLRKSRPDTPVPPKVKSEGGKEARPRSREEREMDRSTRVSVGTDI